MKSKPLIEGKTKGNIRKFTGLPKMANPPPPPWPKQPKTNPEIWQQMDADMEESGVAQGEIEGLKNHWKNKYIIIPKEKPEFDPETTPEIHPDSYRDQAKRFIEVFWAGTMTFNQAQKSALLCCDEILKAIDGFCMQYELSYYQVLKQAIKNFEL